MIWIWVAGAAVLIAGAVVPVLVGRGDNTGMAQQLDQARSMISRLETAIDTAVSNSPSEVAEAHRCLLLAGAALGKRGERARVTSASCRRSLRWSAKGLHALQLDS